MSIVDIERDFSETAQGFQKYLTAKPCFKRFFFNNVTKIALWIN